MERKLTCLKSSRERLAELLLMLRLASRIIRVARDEGVELIHAHSPCLNGLPALWAGRRLGLPVETKTVKRERKGAQQTL